MKNLLFQNLNIKNAGGTAAVCLGLIVISILVESLKLLREHLLLKTNGSCCQQIPNESSQLTLCSTPLNNRLRIFFHIAQAAMHMLQICIGYILMLCVMSFNAWFIIAAVFGLTVGYFMCGAILPKQFEDVHCDTPVVSSAPPSYASTVVD